MSDVGQKTALAPSEVKRINDNLAELEKTVSIVCERILIVKARLLGGEQSNSLRDEKVPSEKVPSGWFNETLHTLNLLNERLREFNATKINELQVATDGVREDG